MSQTKFLIVFLCILGTISNSSCDQLLDSLNGMQKFMTGEDEYDREFYDELVQCINKMDPTNKLLESVNAQWTGFNSYAASGGNPPEDVWERCPEGYQWFEVNCTVQEYGSLPIWEPCNYASNIAYYHTTTELCSRKEWSMPDESVKSIGKAFTSLGLGSAFFHGSQTAVGGASDVRVNDLFGWIVYQEGVKNLPTSQPSVIYELSLEPRNMTAVEVVDYLMNAYIDLPVEDWGVVLEEADFPTLSRCMGGTFGVILTLLLPEEVVNIIVPALIDFFEWIFDEETKEFLLVYYLPEIQNATRHMLPLPQEEHTKLMGNTAGTLIKLFYAFLWQEQAFTDERLLQPNVNEVGAALLPLVNEFATALTTFEHSSPDFQFGQNFWPGQDWCDAWDPHSKWHLETGIALPDLAFLFDEIHRLIETYGKF